MVLPMTRAASALVLLWLVPGVAACGGSDPARGSRPDENDKRATALACLKEDKGVTARPAGKDSIQVGNPATGPRIDFFLNGGEAEAKQFEGSAEGSEQMGSALLFVRQGSKELLDAVEACLDEL